MKLHQTAAAGRNAFTGYGAGYVLVNGVRHESSVIVMPDQPVRPWDVASMGLLDASHVARLAELDVEVVLIGTGERLLFPAPPALRPLALAGIGWEAMDSQAVCRTYNILMGEGRKVAAALVIEPR